MAREINLVPDIKNEMIKTIKLRNLIFFVCLVVVICCVVLVATVGSIAGGQQLVVEGKKNTLTAMTDKLHSYTDLSDYLTIRDQLGNLSAIDTNKKLLSRTFNILSALLPAGPDTITISKMTVNLSGDNPTFTFDAQADAKTEPQIDYNVLDSFKKSMKYMRYDYGTYVDKEDAEIPAYCIIETDNDGAYFIDSTTNSLYAYWDIHGEGCNPSEIETVTQAELDQAEQNSGSSANNNLSTNDNGSNADTTDEDNPDQENPDEENPDTENTKEDDSDTENTKRTNSRTSDPSSLKRSVSQGNILLTENYQGTEVVRIWRTPQFNEWYKNDYMQTDGTISGIAHFNSSCITYTGEENEAGNQVRWVESNDECLLVPDGDNGIRISNSSNGRSAGDELVLRFSAVISLAPEVYSFNNFHMLAIAPTGSHNVTDSYVQIQAMFGEQASDCAEGDTVCSSNTTNVNGG